MDSQTKQQTFEEFSIQSIIFFIKMLDKKIKFWT